MLNNIYNYTYEELTKVLLEHNLKIYAAKQIFNWLYKKNCKTFDAMTNISKKNIKFLKDTFYIPNLELVLKKFDTIDDTTKFLFNLEDLNKIETVLMKFDYGWSVCVTTQVGCNMGCKFCASGQLKKIRDLSAAEIVAQIQYANEYLNKLYNDKVRNIVVMGIGEPFDNYDNLKKFLKIITNDYGIGIGFRKITVSTCGVVSRFEQWTNDFPQVGLAISLHAPNNEIRSKIMPINNAFDINVIIDSVKKYIKATNRRITFEYIMLKDVNDSSENALELSKLLRDILCYVNIIPYNPVDENDFQKSNKVRAFYEILREQNITATVRFSKGKNIDGACGQLRARNKGK